MKSIALGYLDLEKETVKNLESQNPDDVEAFNREVIEKWEYKNFGQVKKLAALLYEAAEDNSYVDPNKIEKILGISKEGSNIETGDEMVDVVTKRDAETMTDDLEQETETSLNDKQDDVSNEIGETVEKVRQHTLDTIRPEIASWAKNYTPKMEDIQTRLLVKNQRGDRGVELNHYEKLFAVREGKKILVSGRLGTGKSLLGKKIAHDWAKGIFTTFSIVFFVSMKLFSPGTPVQNAIVKQYSGEGQNIPEQTVQFVLEKLGETTLVILDDIEEEEISRCLGKHSRLNFVVISCCSDTDNLWKQFEKVCEVQSFSRNEKKRILSLMLKNDSKIAKSLDLNLDIPDFCGLDSSNTMLTTFLCFLVEEKGVEIQNSDTKCQMSLWEIYLKLVVLLCKGNREALKSIGKIAFDSLKGQMSLDISSFEPFADLGLFVLCERKGSPVFHHRPIQVALGSLYFLLMPDEGQTVDEMMNGQTLMFLSDPWFLYFCLGLLGDQKVVSISKREKVYEDLIAFVQEKVDFVQLDLKDMLAVNGALKHCYDDSSNEGLVFNFMQQVLSRCENTKVLIFSPNQLTDRAWKSMQHMLPNLSYILLQSNEFLHNDISDESQFWRLGHISEETDSALNVVLQNQPMEHVNQLLNRLDPLERQLIVRFNHCHLSEPMIDLAVLVRSNVKQLHLHHSTWPCVDFHLFVDSDVIKCHDLTHLTCNDVIIEDVVLACLSRSVQEGHLPNLKFLSLAASKDSVKGNMDVLFKTPWPKLIHLDVSGCQLDHSDMKVKFAATNRCLEDKLPSLRSLAISPDDINIPDDAIENLFLDPWERLNALTMIHVSKANSIFAKVTEKKFFPNLRIFKVSEVQTGISLPVGLHSLTYNSEGQKKLLSIQDLSKLVNHQVLFHLDISFSEVFGGLVYLVRHRLPSLNNLILRRCKLNSQDFQHLAQADQANRLPKLKHLDVAFNDFFDLSWILKSKWQQIESLEIDWMSRSGTPNMFYLLKAVKEGSLSSLRRISLHTPNYYEYELETCRRCESIRTNSSSTVSDI